MSFTIYLAGPEVFLTDAIAVGRRKKALCASYGFDGLYPFDNEPNPYAGERLDRIIYRANVEMIGRADAIIANLTPFRGTSADVGTVFELGLAAGLGKRLLGYTNQGGDLIDRLQRTGAIRQLEGGWTDAAGFVIENFGNADNLMIDCSLASAGHPLVRPPSDVSFPLDDLRGFEACLRILRASSDAGRTAAE